MPLGIGGRYTGELSRRRATTAYIITVAMYRRRPSASFHRPRGTAAAALPILILALLLPLLAFAQPRGQARVQGGAVLHARIDSAIQPVSAEFIRTSIAEADAEHAAAIVFELDTPGGLLTSTRAITTAILEAKTPVVVWVSPRGARAASAGFFILMSADVAAMAPETNTGAAHPVDSGGGDVPAAGVHRVGGPGVGLGRHRGDIGGHQDEEAGGGGAGAARRDPDDDRGLGLEDGGGDRAGGSEQPARRVELEDDRGGVLRVGLGDGRPDELGRDRLDGGVDAGMQHGAALDPRLAPRLGEREERQQQRQNQDRERRSRRPARTVERSRGAASVHGHSNYIRRRGATPGQLTGISPADAQWHGPRSSFLSG